MIARERKKGRRSVWYLLCVGLSVRMKEKERKGGREMERVRERKCEKEKEGKSVREGEGESAIEKEKERGNGGKSGLR